MIYLKDKEPSLMNFNEGAIKKLYINDKVAYKRIGKDEPLITPKTLAFEFTGDSLSYKVNGVAKTATRSPWYDKITTPTLDASSMFENASNLTKIINFPEIKVTNTSNMFSGCGVNYENKTFDCNIFQKANLSSVESMFYSSNFTTINNIPVLYKNKPGGSKTFKSSKITSANLDGINFNATNFNYLFLSCYDLVSVTMNNITVNDINNLDKYMAMFSNCKKLNRVTMNGCDCTLIDKMQLSLSNDTGNQVYINSDQDCYNGKVRFGAQFVINYDEQNDVSTSNGDITSGKRVVTLLAPNTKKYKLYLGFVDNLIGEVKYNDSVSLPKLSSESSKNQYLMVGTINGGDTFTLEQTQGMVKKVCMYAKEDIPKPDPEPGGDKVNIDLINYDGSVEIIYDDKLDLYVIPIRGTGYFDSDFELTILDDVEAELYISYEDNIFQSDARYENYDTGTSARLTPCRNIRYKNTYGSPVDIIHWRSEFNINIRKGHTRYIGIYVKKV